MNKLALLSKIPIPFPQAKLIIHQPSARQISYIGEKDFFSGCRYLNFSKDLLSFQDKNNLNNLSNFEILMTIINEKNPIIQQVKANLETVFSLICPECKVNFLPSGFLFIKQNEEGKQEMSTIDKDNFESFRKIISKIFCLQDFIDKGRYNPGGPQASAIVQKIQEGRRKRAELKGKKDEDSSILFSYISILAVGQRKDINQLFNYSVYQLFQEFRRFKLKEDYDIYLQFKAAGAQNLEDPPNWMGDITQEKN